MSKFNSRGAAPTKAPATSYITTATVPSGRTFEGAPGFARDAKSELFLLAVVNMSGEDTFYEKARDRDSRFAALIRTVAAEDPVWLMRFFNWLRNEANMRSAAVSGALIAAKAMVDTKVAGSRSMVTAALQRADEPGEALAFWTGTFGRKLPKPVKRGIADAATNLYSEFTALKYDTASHQFRFGDVLDLTHPSPNSPVQSALFKHLLDRRHGRAKEPDASLTMINGNAELRRQLALDPKMRITPELLRNTGMTWEDIFSLLGDKVDKAKLWEALIPIMGYMALVRNLRGFSEAGVSKAAIQQVIAKLTDPVQVAKSRQLPLRFVSAYEAVSNTSRDWDKVTWGPALDKALDLCLKNIPELPGRTLVLVDISGSMSDPLSAKSKMTRAKAAGLFGGAVALRNAGRVDLFKYNNTSYPVAVHPSMGLLELAGQFTPSGGTMTSSALRARFQPGVHNRVILITDEQAYGGDPSGSIPKDVPMYTWSLGGYKLGASGGPNRHVFGGLTDQGFQIIPWLEAGESQTWPF